MWTADYIAYKGKEDYRRAYKGDELVWDWSGLTFEVTIPNNATAALLIDHYGTNLTTTKPNIEYSINFNRWFQDDGNPHELKNGDIIRLRGNNDTIGVSSTNFSEIHIKSSGANVNTRVYGNVMSLLSKYDYNTLKTAPRYAFIRLFYGNSTIIDASNLILPATTLAIDCYDSMFRNCASLVTAPALPAKTLASSCYDSMFSGCTSLINAPALPAKTFSGTYCYRTMFLNCTSLVNAPALPATTVTSLCYRAMFEGCASLVNAPVLPATTLQSLCYSYMFGGCTSLVNAPALPATKLQSGCYLGMFRGCTSLVNAPALPAKTLASTCYSGMFNGCSKLVTAPVLPAAEIMKSSYGSMFYNCTKLTYINCKATSIDPDGGTVSWVYKVASAGTFVKNSAATFWTTGTGGIPEGWTVIDAEL